MKLPAKERLNKPLKCGCTLLRTFGERLFGGALLQAIAVTAQATAAVPKSLVCGYCCRRDGACIWEDLTTGFDTSNYSQYLESSRFE